MSIILTNNKLKIDTKTYDLDLNIDDFVDYLEKSHFDKQFKNTGKILSINPTLNGYYSNTIVHIFWEMFLNTNSFPNVSEMLTKFLNKSIDESSFPIKNKEYVLLSYEYVEVKLNSLMYKFYKTYFLICLYLYHFLKLRDQNLLVETNFVDFLNILYDNKTLSASVLNTEKEADIKLFELDKDEDIGDFEFPCDEAYIEISTNIINNTL